MARRQRRGRQSDRSPRGRNLHRSRPDLTRFDAIEAESRKPFNDNLFLTRRRNHGRRSNDSDPEQRAQRSYCRRSAFQGLQSTLCKGCGHNSITSYLIEACKSTGVNPYATVKLSGIGCSSKTPAYFLQASHGFNALHGRMPSVATGATGGEQSLLCIGISGDGDTANIGMGQFKHVCRRNVPIVYIVENNGCYGLTKGQFSATADLNALRRRTPARRTTFPPSTCASRPSSGRAFVARSFAGDKKQLYR